MLISYPDYYLSFKCTASRCRHNCCRGWEIDIDPGSHAKYMSMGGELGERLRENIAGEEPHFVLTEDERCPFLTGDGLCELILTDGEELLCQICADHPRFRSIMPGVTEIGLGLACEEAARLIVERTEPFRLITVGEKTTADERAENILAFRGGLFEIAQDRSKPIDDRMEELLGLVGASLPPEESWMELFMDLERLDEDWTELLRCLDGRAEERALREYMSLHETEAENLLCCFLYRHVPESWYDGDIPSKVSFAVLAVKVILRIAQGAGENIYETARMFSSEIEYSDENLDILMDTLFS